MTVEGNIDLVCIDDIGYFYFQDDAAYGHLGGLPGRVIVDYEPRAFSHNLPDMQARFRRERHDGFFEKMIEIWGCEPDIYDVGTHVGRWSLPLALFAQQRDIDSCVFQFEPGRTASLLPYTLQINKLRNVQLVEAVVSDFDGIASLRFDPTILVSARAYKPAHAHITRLCRSISLDSFRATHVRHRPALVKIDTEGHEVSVLRGAKNLLDSGQYIVTMEYRDWLMNSGRDVLDPLFESSYVFDVGQNMRIPYIVPVTELEGHFERVSSKRLKVEETDLLFISKRISNLQQILALVHAHPKFEH